MKKLLLWISALISLVLTIILVLGFYLVNVDPNQHKNSISNQFLERTGRTLDIAGDIHLSIYPWLGIEVNEFTVGNAPGFGDTPLFQAQRAHVRIKLMPLLNEQYEIDTIELEGANINLIINEQGQANWAEINSDNSSSVSSTSSEELSVSNVILGGVNIQNANVNYSDQTSGQQIELDALNIKTEKLVYGEPIQLAMDFNASAAQPNVSSAINASGTIVYDIDNQHYQLNTLVIDGTLNSSQIPSGSTILSVDTSIDFDMQNEVATIQNLELDILDTHLSASWTGRNLLDDSPSFETDLLVNGNDLALLFRVAEIDKVAEQIDNLDSREFNFSTSAHVDLAKGNISLNSLQANLLGANISGDVTAASINSDTPSFTGEITANGPDLPTLLAVAGQLQGGSNSIISQYASQLSATSNKAFELNSQFNINLATGNIQVPNLNAKFLGFNMNGNFSAEEMNSKSGSAQGSFNLTNSKLTDLFNALEQTQLSNISQTLDLSLALQGDQDTINIEDLKLQLDDSLVEGQVAISNFSDPSFEFNIAIDTINLDDYMLDTQVPNSANSPSQSEGLPNEALKDLKLKGQLTIKQIISTNLSLDDLQINIVADSGLININPIQANLYQGQLLGDISLDARQNIPSIEINNSLTRFAVSPLMEDLMGSAPLSGIGNVSFSLQSIGNDIIQLKQGLTGSGNVDLQDGILQGVDVASVLAQVETMIRNERLSEVRRGEQTQFDNLSTSFTASNGIIRSNDFLLTSPGFEVKGQGTLFNLNNDSIDFQLLTSVDESTATNDSEEYDIGGYTLPISCTGNIESIRCLPDLQEIISSALRQALGRGVNNLLQRALGVEDNDTDETEVEQPNEAQEPPQSIENELLNRALDRLFQ